MSHADVLTDPPLSNDELADVVPDDPDVSKPYDVAAGDGHGCDGCEKGGLTLSSLCAAKHCR